MEDHDPHVEPGPGLTIPSAPAAMRSLELRPYVLEYSFEIRSQNLALGRLVHLINLAPIGVNWVELRFEAGGALEAAIVISGVVSATLPTASTWQPDTPYKAVWRVDARGADEVHFSLWLDGQPLWVDEVVEVQSSGVGWLDVDTLADLTTTVRHRLDDLRLTDATEIFGDGFESGDLSGWPTALP